MQLPMQGFRNDDYSFIWETLVSSWKSFFKYYFCCCSLIDSYWFRLLDRAVIHLLFIGARWWAHCVVLLPRWKRRPEDRHYYSGEILLLFLQENPRKKSNQIKQNKTKQNKRKEGERQKWKCTRQRGWERGCEAERRKGEGACADQRARATHTLTLLQKFNFKFKCLFISKFNLQNHCILISKLILENLFNK